MLTDKQKKEFSDFFIDRYLSRGFGTMTKSEIDILIFHLIYSSSEIIGKSNYEISNRLKITESKVKNLKLNASLRYGEVNHKKALSSIVNKITASIKIQISKAEPE